MQKTISWLLLMVMLLLPFGAGYAEAADASAAQFTMAGFDDEATGHVWETNLFFQRMQEKTGVTFDFIQYSDEAQWSAAKAAMFSGEAELPDVLFKAELTHAEQLDGYEKGVLIDLKPYLEQYAPNLWATLQANPQWLQDISLPDGAIVALPAINQLQNNNALWINSGWLETLGLETPKTAEELTEVLRLFKTRDPNRNGKTDEVPMTFTSMWDLRFLGHAFGLVSNDYYVYVDENGKVASTLTKEENRAFLTWLNQLWQEKLIDQNGFTSLDSSRQITDGDADITYGVFPGPTPMNMVPADALSAYNVLMPMVYEGKQVYRDFAGDLVGGTYALTSACEDPAALISWVDFLYTEEGCYLMQAGQEGVEYLWNNDGTWGWIYDAETVASTVLSESTICDGGSTPGLASVDFQMAYDDALTQRVIGDLVKLKEMSVVPYPAVWLDNAVQQRVNEIQMDMALYAEQQMVWFVVGDVPLNDQTWDEFCKTLNEKGLNEMLSIWQDALDKR